MSSVVYSFDVSVVGREWSQTVNARSRGKAKVDYWRQVIDAWPDVPFTAMRCRKIGGPRSSAAFIHNAQYRGMPEIRCGQRVQVGGSLGVIVGHNASANFDVLFDDNAPKYAGLTLNVHPSDVVLIP